MDQRRALELVEEIKTLARSADYSSSELTAFIACARNANLDQLTPGRVKDQRIEQIYCNANRVLAQIVCKASEKDPRSLFTKLLEIHTGLVKANTEEIDSKQLVFRTYNSIAATAD